jgi:transposase-like protein
MGALSRSWWGSTPQAPLFIRVEMTDADVVARAARLLGVSPVSIPARRKKWKPSFSATVRGAPAVLLLGRLRPLLGERRRRQVDRALSCYVPPAPPKLNAKAIRTIKTELVKGASVSSLSRRFDVARATIRWARDRSST